MGVRGGGEDDIRVKFWKQRVSEQNIANKGDKGVFRVLGGELGELRFGNPGLGHAVGAGG